MNTKILISIALFLIVSTVTGFKDKQITSLVFEVDNKEEFCLYQHFNLTINYIVEYGVVKGGNLDIDFQLITPNDMVLYKAERKDTKDSLVFTSTTNGDFRFCFSNVFSQITHKIVYFDLRPLDERELSNLQQEANVNIPTALSPFETFLNDIHTLMSNVTVVQLFYKHQEIAGSNFALKLNLNVQMWSLLQLAIILIASMAQVTMVKRLFTTTTSKRMGF